MLAHDTVPTADPRIGMILQDRYRIVRKLGEGGMGAVYEAEHVLIRKRVAVKCLHAQFAQNPDIVARFQREAMAATSVGHANIIEVTDLGRFPDGAVFMVLEFLDGRDFSKLIETEGPQPVARVVHIVSQICDALYAAHTKGIVHRDLKPENVFLIQRGEDRDFVKVLDFGISKMKGSDGSGHGMTRTGMAMGTPYYMAPEQAQGLRDLDHRADIYALGVILFRALTGQHPFDHESYPMLVVKICTEPPPPLRKFRPDLPEALEQIVGRMLAKNPADRYEDCLQVKSALAPFRQYAVGAPVMVASRSDTLKLGSAGATPAKPLVAPPIAVAEPKKVTRPVGAQTGSTTSSTMGDLPTGLRKQLGGRSRSQPTSILPWAIAGLSVAMVVGGAAALWVSGGFTPRGPTQIILQQPSLAAVANGAAPPPTGRTVTVRIATDPIDAQLYMDGDRIPNPFDGDLPYGADAHRLEARKDGFVTVVQDLVLRIPQRITITMSQGSGTDDQRRVRVAQPAGPVVARPPGHVGPHVPRPPGPTAPPPPNVPAPPPETPVHVEPPPPAPPAAPERPAIPEPGQGPPPAQAIKRIRI